MKDYPPERIVMDMLETCMTLREQRMAVMFENNDSEYGAYVSLGLFDDKTKITEWLETDAAPLVRRTIWYRDDGRGCGELVEMLQTLRGYVKNTNEVAQ